jgi:hypothetical protein
MMATLALAGCRYSPGYDPDAWAQRRVQVTELGPLWFPIETISLPVSFSLTLEPGFLFIGEAHFSRGNDDVLFVGEGRDAFQSRPCRFTKEIAASQLVPYFRALQNQKVCEYRELNGSSCLGLVMYGGSVLGAQMEHVRMSDSCEGHYLRFCDLRRTDAPSEAMSGLLQADAALICE